MSHQHQHHGGCSHDHGHDHGHDHSHGHDHDHDHDHDHSHDHGHSHSHGHDHKIKNADNLDVPAEADIDLDAMHPEVQIPSQQFPLTEQELRDDFVMLTEDGGIKKKILTESKQPDLGSPPEGSKVICHYTGTLPNNNDEKFDSSRDRNDPFNFTISQGQVIKGWDIGIASMKKGERCILRCASPYAYGENGSPPKIPGGATLDFDVELIDWDDWEECSGSDGKISKKTVIKVDGFDNDISEDAVVTISYRIYYIDNDIDQILCERKKIEMTVSDDDRFTEGFHIALKSMKEGEKSIFKILDNELLDNKDLYIDPDELKQNEFNNNKMKPPSDDKRVFIEINVHKMVKSKEKWNAKNEERIEMGMKYKNDGNVLFKGKRFNAAINKYKKALDWIDVDFTEDELAKKKEELIISTNNNIALICIKKKDWSGATEHATKVLEKEPNNLKALMRRGQARLNDGFLELSKKDLKKAQSMDKNNSYIKKLLKICTVKHKQYIQKQQALYAGMFGKKKSKKGGGKKKKMDVEDTNKNDKNDEEKEKEEVTKTGDDKENVSKMEIDTDKAVRV